MTVVFDTNVILDAAMARNDFESAQKLVEAVIEEKIVGVVTANTITDIHYIVKKRAGDSAARAVVRGTLDVFEVTHVDGEICESALNLPMEDFEDAVLAVCAHDVGADYIATGDEGLINSGESPALPLRPADILAALRNGEE